MATTPSYDNGREEIRLLVKKINDAWLDCPPQKIAAFKNMGRGKSMCIKSYQDFVQQADIRECTISEPDIDIFDDTATATYSWDMVYTMNRKTYHEGGYDLFVFARKQGRWLAVWRAVLPGSRLEQLKAVPHY